jgi:hypothetical protein
MARSFAVFGLAFAGVLMLAGTGWALLTGAGLVVVLWRREPDWRGLAARVTVGMRSAAARVRAAPRRSVAGAGMAGGVVLAPAGFTLAAGLGVGLIAGAVALVGVGLLTGWNA